MNEVTVIIPAYNAERTVGRAVKSVLASTVPVDVVVVDDGSSDATAAAAESAAAECAAERGSSFRLVRQANAGAYTARVRALAGVETPYFAFVYADDAVEPSMYERLVAFSRANDLDIAQCDAVGTARASVPQELFLGEAQVREKVVLPRLMRGEGAVSVWDKLYRNRLGGIEFEPSDIMMFDDLAINLQLFIGAERVGYLHEGLYRYDVNPGSSVRNFRLKNVSDLKEAIRFREKFLPRLTGGDCDGRVMAAWVVRNVRNMYLVACSAPVRDGVSRMEKVRALLDFSEVEKAFAELGLSFRRRVMRTRTAVALAFAAKRLKALTGE